MYHIRENCVAVHVPENNTFTYTPHFGIRKLGLGREISDLLGTGNIEEVSYAYKET